jgi:hypothetical protein
MDYVFLVKNYRTISIHYVVFPKIENFVMAQNSKNKFG